MDILTVFDFLSETFNLPLHWFASPTKFIFYFLIPLASLITLWTIFLTYKLRIFKNDAVNFGIGCVIALLNSALIEPFTPPVIVAVGVGGSLMFSGRMTFWRAVGAFVLFMITVFLYPEIIRLFGVGVVYYH